MTVKDLIELLSKFPPDIQVAYCRYSEQCLLDANELTVQGLCVERPDGWLQNARPDMPTKPYLVFPGN